MAQIVELNFPDIQKELLDYAISVFYQYHENSEIEKKPSTPELLAWIRVLSKNFDGSIPDDVPHKEILLKYQEDQEFDIGKIYNIDNIYKSSENENKLNSRQFSLNFEQRVDLYKIFYQYLDGFEINQGDMFNIEREEDYDNGDYYVIELSAKNEDDNFAWTTQEEVTRMIDRILGYSNY